jgi:HSP20 family protein
MAIRFDNPLNTLLDIQKALESVFESPYFGKSVSTHGTYPGINIFEDDDNFYLIAELPGLKKENIDLRITGDTISISGTKEPKTREDAAIHRNERAYGEFSRSFTLPDSVKNDKIDAKYEFGILWMTLPKAEEAKSKQITIS